MHPTTTDEPSWARGEQSSRHGIVRLEQRSVLYMACLRSMMAERWRNTGLGPARVRLCAVRDTERGSVNMAGKITRSRSRTIDMTRAVSFSDPREIGRA